MPTPILQQKDVFEALCQRRRQAYEQVQQTHAVLLDRVHAMTQPAKRATTRMEKVSAIVGNGMAIWQGIRIGMSVIRGIRYAFGRK